MRRRFPLALAAALSAPLFLGGCTAAGVVNALTSSAGYAVETNIRYAPGPRGTLDLYVPDGAGATAPVVVFFYGGSWDSGSKDLYQIGRAHV